MTENMRVKKNGHVAFILSEGRGHAVPAFQLANVLAERFGCLCTVIWIAHNLATVEAMAKQQTRAGKVEILILPCKADNFLDASKPDFWRTEMVPKIQGAVEASGRPLTVVIGDFMLYSVHVIKEEFKVPAWQFFVSPLAFMGVMYEFHCDRTRFGGKGIDFPDIGIIEAIDLPPREEKFDIVELSRKVEEDAGKCDGILVNDCREVYSDEYYAFTTRKAPCKGPVLTIGPLAARDLRLSPTMPADETIIWLNSKPPRSVVFCALGSVWSLPPRDAYTMAKCNAECGKYVLWAHRTPDPRMTMIGSKNNQVPDDFDTETWLPKDYTPDNVHLSQWVNQPAVLTHPAVACFITHCGWNSTAEAMTFGMPLVCLPICADQLVVAKMIERSLGNGKAAWYGPERGALDPRTYLDTVNQVCGNSAYLDNARKIQETINHSTNSSDGLGSKNLEKFAVASSLLTN